MSSRDPMHELYGDLCDRGAPSLAWVARWGQTGHDPLFAAWMNARVSEAMLDVVEYLEWRGLLPPGTCRAATRARSDFALTRGDRCRTLEEYEYRCAVEIREVVPVLPPLSDLLAAEAARRG